MKVRRNTKRKTCIISFLTNMTRLRDKTNQTCVVKVTFGFNEKDFKNKDRVDF